ncbi:MAG: AAA family ATPase [Planctomycetota bacterium]
MPHRESISDLDRLERLCRASRPLVVMQTFEEDEALQLVRDASMSSKGRLAIWTVLSGVYDGILDRPNPIPDTTKPLAGLNHLAFNDDASIACLVDITPHLEEPRVLRAFRDLITEMRRRGGTVIVIDHNAGLPEVVRAHAVEFEIGLPDTEELEQIVRRTVKDVHRGAPLEVDVSKDDFQAMLRNLRGLTRRQAEEVIRDIALEDGRIDASDIDEIIRLKREMVAAGGLLEFVRAPTSMAEIGGLDRLKQWLHNRRGALDAAEDDSSIDVPRGVLLLGVQGAGKSLCAKAIATAWQRPLLRMDVGALYDKYIGESERRLRDTLHQAEVMAPVILWIDEIEKAFAGAASQSNDGGLSRRMFGTLLTWMKEHRAPVFLVATANDIEALPPELLRKGRFDEIFFVDLPGDEARAAILGIHLSRRGIAAGSLDIPRLVESSAGFSGAEIEQAIIAARHEARANSEPVSTESLVRLLETSPPLSVTMAEKVAELRAWSEGRCVPAE